MKAITLDSLSDATNCAIIKLPERRFPGMVIQGDSLSILLSMAEGIQQMVKDSPDDELRDCAAEMVQSLQSLLEHYENVLKNEKISLPYVRHPNPVE